MHALGMWRLLLLRILPRRLLPLLFLFEIVQLVRRMRSHDAPPSVRYDDRIIEGHATPVPPRAIDRGA